MSFWRTLAPTAAPLSARDLAVAVRSAASADRVQIGHEIGQYLGVNRAMLYSSGRAALTVLLQALAALRPGRCVAIPAYTCYSVPAAIFRAGLKPVLIDLDTRTLDFADASLREVLAQPDLLCVVPTHLFGVAANVRRVRALCRDEVFVIEDAAQALGVCGQDGRLLGLDGDAAVFSLGRGKHLTCGRGGMVTARESTIAASCRELPRISASTQRPSAMRQWGELALISAFVDPRVYRLPASMPFLGLGRTEYSTDFPIATLSPVGVGALRTWRSRLASSNTARAANVAGLQRVLGNSIAGCEGPLLRYPVLLPSSAARNRFVEAGHRLGLGVSAMYPTGIHQIPALREFFGERRYAGAEALADRLATVPTHQFVRPADVQRIQRLYHDVMGHGATADAKEAVTV